MFFDSNRDQRRLASRSKDKTSQSPMTLMPALTFILGTTGIMPYATAAGTNTDLAEINGIAANRDSDIGNRETAAINTNDDPRRRAESSQSGSTRQPPSSQRHPEHKDNGGKQHPWLENQPYRRLTPAWYADGVGQPVAGPNARYISNRIFADSAQNLFSETGVTQWAYTWGQFIDHTVALRKSGDEVMEIAFDPNDPLEQFDNSNNNLTMKRSAAAPGSGVDSPREQINTITSRIDAWAIYGGDKARLEWLREGPVDGSMDNNNARLLLPDNYLPVMSARGDASAAPVMEKMGQLFAAADADDQQVVAGDVRANENIALTTVQTLFAREHNRIVALLPEEWSEEEKFRAARAWVTATQQYITYNEFLPALGVFLDTPQSHPHDSTRSRGEGRMANPRVTQEFATVGYRAHSMIHGEIELEVPADHYDAVLLAGLQAQGIPMEIAGEDIEIAVPLNIAHGNPQLVPTLGLAPLSLALAAEPQYKNDEQFDNQLRSVLFQLPSRYIEDPDSCLDGPILPLCYRLVQDLGVLDIMRAREHGIAPYNVLRKAFGLAPAITFTDITGESSSAFPDDELIDNIDPINDPDIMDFVALFDADGLPIALDSEAAEGEAVTGIRRSSLAARLKAIYQDIDTVDAFVGMVSEPHLPGTDFGELQHAIWKHQFEALRDGDERFYLWNRRLRNLERELQPLGLDYRQRLADLVANNTELTPQEVPENLFITAED